MTDPNLKRPSHLDYNRHLHIRSITRFLGIALLITAVLAGVYLYLSNMKTQAEINQINIQEGASPAPSVFDPESCPPGKFLDCRDHTPSTKPECDKEYIQWAKSKCPGFVGASF